VVDDYAVAGLQPPAVGADGDDLAARFVAGDDPLVCLWSGAQVLTVDGPDVAAADRGRLHPEQRLTVSRFRHLDLDMLDSAVAREADAVHD
jgi:hypothetical protein